MATKKFKFARKAPNFPVIEMKTVAAGTYTDGDNAAVSGYIVHGNHLVKSTDSVKEIPCYKVTEDMELV